MKQPLHRAPAGQIFPASSPQPAPAPPAGGAHATAEIARHRRRAACAGAPRQPVHPTVTGRMRIVARDRAILRHFAIGSILRGPACE